MAFTFRRAQSPSTGSEGLGVLGHSPEPPRFLRRSRALFQGNTPKHASGSSAFTSQKLGQSSRESPRDKRALPSQRQRQLLEINKNSYSTGTDSGRNPIVPMRRQRVGIDEEGKGGEGQFHPQQEGIAFSAEKAARCR